MQDSAARIYHILHKYSTWIAVALMLLYGIVMWMTYFTPLGMLGGKWVPLVLVALAVIGLFFIYTIHDPYPVIVLMVAGTYMGSLITIVEDGLIPFSLFQLLLVAAFAIFFAHRLYTKNFELKITGLELEWTLFFLVISLSLIYAPDPFDGLIYFLRYLVLFGMMYMIINVIHRSEHITYLLYSLILISVILAGISIFMMAVNPDRLIEGVATEGARLNRETLLEMDPNRFAALFLLPIAFLSSVSMSGWMPRYRLIAIVLLFIMLLGVFGTYSRSVIIAAAIMLILIAVLYRQYYLFIWFAALGLLTVILVPDLRYFAITVISRVVDIFAGATDDSSRIRILLGLAAIYMFLDSYMIGVGFRGFQHHFTDYFSVQESIGVVMPHNIFYTVASELGLIGLLIFGYIVWKIGVVGYDNITQSHSRIQRANSVALFSSYIALLVFYQFYGGAMFDNNLWAIIALIFAQQWLILNNK